MEAFHGLIRWHEHVSVSLNHWLYGTEQKDRLIIVGGHGLVGTRDRGNILGDAEPFMYICQLLAFRI